MPGMPQRRVRCVNTAQPGLAHLETEIDVRMRDRRIHRIESADPNEIFPPHREAGRGKRGHVAQRLRQVEMLGRIRRALMKSGPGQPAHAHDQTGVLNFSGLVKELRRNRAHLGILQRLDQILDPIGLVGLDVVIEKNQPLARGRFRADDCICRKN